MSAAQLWAMMIAVWAFAMAVGANCAIGSSPPKCVYDAQSGEYLGMWGPDAEADGTYVIGPCRVRGNGAVIMGGPSVELGR